MVLGLSPSRPLLPLDSEQKKKPFSSKETLAQPISNPCGRSLGWVRNPMSLCHPITHPLTSFRTHFHHPPLVRFQTSTRSYWLSLPDQYRQTPPGLVSPKQTNHHSLVPHARPLHPEPASSFVRFSQIGARKPLRSHRAIHKHILSLHNLRLPWCLGACTTHSSHRDAMSCTAIISM